VSGWSGMDTSEMTGRSPASSGGSGGPWMMPDCRSSLVNDPHATAGTPQVLGEHPWALRSAPAEFVDELLTALEV
jgi:hypothetical protein